MITIDDWMHISTLKGGCSDSIYCVICPFSKGLGISGCAAGTDMTGREMSRVIFKEQMLKRKIEDLL